MTANIASDRPLLVLVDDLQWADEPSLRWLGYLVRRLEGLPVLVVAALRPPEQGFEKVLLSELVADPAARLVLPKALSHAAVEALVRSVLSADADEAFSRACFEATGGNPLLLRALLDALASEKVPPRADQAGAVMEIGPTAVARAVELRLARLPSEAGALARAAAVLGEDAELGVVAALADLDRDVAAHAATALSKATILRFETTLGFVHPVVRAAIYAQLTPPELERAPPCGAGAVGQPCAGGAHRGPAAARSSLRRRLRDRCARGGWRRFPTPRGPARRRPLPAACSGREAR